MYRTFSIIYYVFNCIWRYKCLGNKEYGVLTTVPKVFSNFNIYHNFEKLPSYNSIILANYPSERLGYLAHKLVPRKLCYVSSVRGKGILSTVYSEDEMILVNDSKKKNFEKIKEMIRDKIQRYSIFVYVNDNNTRLHDYHIGKLRKGMFYIAHELGIPITPITFSYINPVFGILTKKNYYIKVGETEKVTDPKQSMKKTHKFLQNTIITFRDLS